MCWVGNCN